MSQETPIKKIRFASTTSGDVQEYVSLGGNEETALGGINSKKSHDVSTRYGSGYNNEKTNDVEHMICHENFGTVLALSSKVKAIRKYLSGESKLLLPITNSDDVTIDENIKDMWKVIRMKICGEGANTVISRGTHPHIDSLIDESIEVMKKELHKCILHQSLYEKAKDNKQDLRKRKGKKNGNRAPIAVKYSKAQTDILTNWMIENRKNPFPKKDEIFDLARKTNLTTNQIVNWTTNVRKRNLKATVKHGKKPIHFLDYIFKVEYRARDGQTPSTSKMKRGRKNGENPSKTCPTSTTSKLSPEETVSHTQKRKLMNADVGSNTDEVWSQPSTFEQPNEPNQDFKPSIVNSYNQYHPAKNHHVYHHNKQNSFSYMPRQSPYFGFGQVDFFGQQSSSFQSHAGSYPNHWEPIDYHRHKANASMSSLYFPKINQTDKNILEKSKPFTFEDTLNTPSNEHHFINDSSSKESRRFSDDVLKLLEQDDEDFSTYISREFHVDVNQDFRKDSDSENSFDFWKVAMLEPDSHFETKDDIFSSDDEETLSLIKGQEILPTPPGSPRLHDKKEKDRLDTFDGIHALSRVFEDQDILSLSKHDENKSMKKKVKRSENTEENVESSFAFDELHSILQDEFDLQVVGGEILFSLASDDES